MILHGMHMLLYPIQTCRSPKMAQNNNFSVVLSCFHDNFVSMGTTGISMVGWMVLGNMYFFYSSKVAHF